MRVSGKTLTLDPSFAGEGRTLNYLVRRERAGDVRIDLDLHGRMIDLETLREIATQLMKEVIARMAFWHDQMAGKRVFGRAHRFG